ncbi:hypothetical protein, partial [Cereibacter changlensis]|uniref:hypothetical protein n=1 Tax=Cereibacter changlensis TaxID=402884 RepID=UPI00200B1F8D
CFMGRTEIAAFRRKSYKTLQAMTRKTTAFHRKINGMGIVQGGLSMSSDRIATFFVFTETFPIIPRFGSRRCRGVCPPSNPERL